MSQVISVDPNIQGGTPCFVGTRVPLACFVDALKHNRSIEYFLESYPSVTREQVDALIEEMAENTLASVAAS